MIFTLSTVDKERGWHYIGVGKSNRWFKTDSGRHKLGKYGRNVLNNSGRWVSITGLRTTQRYCIAQRIGFMKGLGTVKVVFSRRRGDKDGIALITDGYLSGCFLLQVVTKTRWTTEESLNYCCAYKAGLLEYAWEEPNVEAYLFTAKVFGTHWKKIKREG